MDDPKTSTRFVTRDGGGHQNIDRSGRGEWGGGGRGKWGGTGS
jgi:hypothetical protein